MEIQQLASHKATKHIVDKYGFKFTKSLGQNFLVDGNILDKIVDASEITKEDVVFEIGTGIGTLTAELAKRAKKVVAIEIDSKLIPILEETLSEFDNIHIINQDILKTDIQELAKKLDITTNIKVVANLPYYITTAIIMKFLESKLGIDKIVVMVQKEVADRMAAKHSTKSYGSLSVAIQYYGEVELISKVPKGAFVPSPGVDSSVISINIHSEKEMEVDNLDLFFKVVRGSFSKRRKTIYNSLGTYENFDKEIILKALTNINIDPNRRGETLSIDEFAELSNSINRLI